MGTFWGTNFGLKAMSDKTVSVNR